MTNQHFQNGSYQLSETEHQKVVLARQHPTLADHEAVRNAGLEELLLSFSCAFPSAWEAFLVYNNMIYKASILASIISP